MTEKNEGQRLGNLDINITQSQHKPEAAKVVESAPDLPILQV